MRCLHQPYCHQHKHDSSAVLRQQSLLRQSEQIASRAARFGVVQFPPNCENRDDQMGPLALLRAGSAAITANTHGINAYVEAGREHTPLSPEHDTALCHLSKVVHHLATVVFGWDELLARSIVRVYWEERQMASGSRWIAFNRAGELYFNAYFFHEKNMSQPQNTRHALSYWFVVFCHELAHNASSEHNQVHEQAEEHLLQHFMVRFADNSLHVAGRTEAAGSTSSSSAPATSAKSAGKKRTRSTQRSSAIGSNSAGSIVDLSTETSSSQQHSGRTCSRCTFDNHSSRAACEMCEAPL